MIIKIVTISLMAVFYICYFAKMISQKKQGIKTDQLGKGKEGFVKFIEAVSYTHLDVYKRQPMNGVTLNGILRHSGIRKAC